MDCIEMLMEAIEFMETHLLEPINYEDVARHLFVSNFYFHRIFSMFTGYTANDYIRRRRLSMAGQELILSDAKIIDIALKYGYDTPESFTRAFTRFHGVTPTLAKRSGYPLKSFNRLIIKLTLEGGTMLDYRIEKRDTFSVLVKEKAFRNEIVNEEGNHEIPDFWEESGNNGLFDQLSKYCTSSDTYGLCSPISKESDYFKYAIGREFSGNDVPDGLTLWQIPAGLWAIFSCYGTNGDCISEMWDRIHTEFLPSSEYILKDAADFELYPSNGGNLFCEIWVPVEKKH